MKEKVHIFIHQAEESNHEAINGMYEDFGNAANTYPCVYVFFLVTWLSLLPYKSNHLRRKAFTAHH